MRGLAILTAAAALALFPAASRGQPAGDKAAEILIGVEYAPPGLAQTFADLKVPAVKLYPDEITWGKMQKAAGTPLDFKLMDRFVREYQEAGFRELVLVLKSACGWASVHPRTNLTPKPEFAPHFERWVRAVVER